jgi:hypothetical protein
MSLFGRCSSYNKICWRAAATRFDPPSQKGLRCRISPTCTLSQNGYGANWGASLLPKSTFCTRACNAQIEKCGRCVGSVGVPLVWSERPWQWHCPFSHGWNKRQADFGAAALTRSRGAQSDQQRTRQHEQQLWSTLRFLRVYTGRPRLARGALEQHCRVSLASASGTRRNIARPRTS